MARMTKEQALQVLKQQILFAVKGSDTIYRRSSTNAERPDEILLDVYQAQNGVMSLEDQYDTESWELGQVLDNLMSGYWVLPMTFAGSGSEEEYEALRNNTEWQRDPSKVKDILKSIKDKANKNLANSVTFKQLADFMAEQVEHLEECDDPIHKDIIVGILRSLADVVEYKIHNTSEQKARDERIKDGAEMLKNVFRGDN